MSTDPGRAEAIQTPTLRLDLQQVERNVAELRSAFPGVELWYALKCNPHWGVVSTLNRLDVGFEVASSSELKHLLQAGVAGNRIMCLHPVKTPEFLRLLQDADVNVVAAGSREELEKIARWLPDGRVLIRLDSAGAGCMVPLGGRYCCPPAEVAGLLYVARQLGLKPSGLTCHIGSQCESIDAWRRLLQSVRSVCDDLIERDLRPEIISLGGGIPAPYAESLPEWRQIGIAVSEGIPRELLSFGSRVTIEPGRAVVASAGTLVTTVVGVAQRTDVRWVFLDAGIYQGLFERLPAAGGIPHPIEVDLPGRTVCAQRLAGPTCDSLDVLSGVVMLPELHEGDHVAFRCAGAYSTAMATSFNGFRPPLVELLQGTNVQEAAYA